MNWTMEVFADGEWVGNMLVFATEKEATEYGNELLSRWYVPSASRAVQTDAPVNYRFDFESYKAVRLEV